MSDAGQAQQKIYEGSVDERTEAALLLLKGLNPLQEQADQEGFGFLSYLLRMAVLEVQAIASGSVGESDKISSDIDDSSYDIGAHGDAGSAFYENRC